MKPNYFLLFIVLLAIQFSAIAQVSNPTNTGFVGQYVGWDFGSGIPVDINNSSTNPIDFYTTGGTWPFSNLRARVFEDNLLAPDGTNYNVGRMHIREDASYALIPDIPVSLLHLGSSWPIGAGGHRTWMDVGTFTNGGTDNMYFGLKHESDPANLSSQLWDDQMDAIISWGDNEDSPDNLNDLRFIFAAPLGSSIGPGFLSGTQDGFETMRITWNGLVGIGNFYIPGQPPASNAIKPMRRLDVLDNGLNEPQLRLTFTQNTNVNNGEHVDFMATSLGDLFINARGGLNVHRFVGINTALPLRTFEIFDNGAVPQFRITQNPTVGAPSRFTDFETTSNGDLVISPRANTTPGRVGINTGSVPANTLEITNGTTGNSGLTFTNLTSTFIPTALSTGKVLTVDLSGNVILVPDQGAGSINSCAGSGNTDHIMKYNNSAGTSACQATMQESSTGYVSFGAASPAFQKSLNLLQNNPNTVYGVYMDMTSTTAKAYGNYISATASASSSTGSKIISTNNGGNDAFGEEIDVTNTSSGPSSGIILNTTANSNQANGIVLTTTSNGSGDAYSLTTSTNCSSGTTYDIKMTPGNFNQIQYGTYMRTASSAATVSGSQKYGHFVDLSGDNEYNYGYYADIDGASRTKNTYGLYARVTGATDGSTATNYGVEVQASGSTAINNIGVSGRGFDGNTTIGVYGEGHNGSRINIGVDGDGYSNSSTPTYGVRGNASSGSDSYGVFGTASNATNNYGVWGEAAHSGTLSYGVYGTVVTNTCATGACPRAAGYFNGALYHSGGIFTTSDIKLKNNIQPLIDASAILSQLQVKTYFYDTLGFPSMNFKPGMNYGLIAQDVEQVLPSFVQTFIEPERKDSLGIIVTAAVDFKAVSYESFIPLLLKGFQEQKDIIADQQEQLDSLKSVLSGNLPRNNSGNNPDVNSQRIELSNNQGIILNQNDPNPFAESTQITYYIPDGIKEAKIMFSDNKGRVLRSAKIETLGEGTLEVYASDLSSGIYTYTLICDGKVIDSKKMIKQ